MRAVSSLIILLIVSTGCEDRALHDVRATLDDGQIVVGAVVTPTLRLQSQAGLLEVPLDDVGEVRPSEGGALSASNGNVSLWLRNGTELVGQWADPELAMGLEIGGGIANVELPAEELLRLQLQGGADFPVGDVYRVRTLWGDDVVVDPEETTLSIESTLGTFHPTLAECAEASPIAEPDGDWRIELMNGTVLIGPLTEESLTFGLPRGPEAFTVPLTAFAGLEHQRWAGGETWSSDSSFLATKIEEDLLLDTASPSPPGPANAPEMQKLSDAPGWFSSSGLRQERQYQRTK